MQSIKDYIENNLERIMYIEITIKSLYKVRVWIIQYT